MRSRLVVAAAVAVLASLGLVTGIAPALAAHSAASTAKLQVHKGKLGTFIVDAKGMTLYLFEKDKGGKSSCSGACAKAWGPYTSSAKATAGKGVNASKIGSTRRADGSMQVTYAGHPLYHFVKDTKAGQTAGQGLTAFGAPWYVVAPSGKKIDPS
jgi:predicted lipoprotein with Yx(FWY)xxD motif